ncbi:MULTISPECIES: hypothetical protein [Nostocales]|uniref:hypothetical protein n=1 Tax=Nostocales TaxID=1161 RepID=UPI001686ED44|nr:MULTISPECIES: hypothetical protein [Nostocales]MBD2298835.1 hypothetical protein [Nostoc sp. FACHB-190]MBD2491609.1 hypothetical protein [Aulosira sp. FACHB-615]
MTYQEQLHPWCIIRVLSNQQLSDNAGDISNVIARFRRRDDAVAYLQVLQHSSKNIKFLIIFDMQGVRNLPKNKALS